MNPKKDYSKLLLFAFYFFGINLYYQLYAKVSLPSIFSDHMVLQRNQINRIWGQADGGEQITVSIAHQSHITRANNDGYWQIQINPMASSKVGYSLVIEGPNRIVIEDVLVGEVWLCSGQSNMEWPIWATYDSDIERIIAWSPHVRLISIPKVGTQEAQIDFKGKWEKATPKTVMNFSAVGFFLVESYISL